MTATPATRIRNTLIALAAIALGVGLFFGNALRNQTVGLEAVASRATPWEEARANGRPTLLEFYADWCTTCRAMAPLMADLETRFGQQVNFVMLNVDNPKWLPELSQFHVNGIPHFAFLDPAGRPLGTAIGEQPAPVMLANLAALQAGEPLSAAASGRTSGLSASAQPRQPDPRSHG